jgi:hypothetical protein
MARPSRTPRLSRHVSERDASKCVSHARVASRTIERPAATFQRVGDSEGIDDARRRRHAASGANAINARSCSFITCRPPFALNVGALPGRGIRRGDCDRAGPPARALQADRRRRGADCTSRRSFATGALCALRAHPRGQSASAGRVRSATTSCAAPARRTPGHRCAFSSTSNTPPLLTGDHWHRAAMPPTATHTPSAAQTLCRSRARGRRRIRAARRLSTPVRHSHHWRLSAPPHRARTSATHNSNNFANRDREQRKKTVRQEIDNRFAYLNLGFD